MTEEKAVHDSIVKSADNVSAMIEMFLGYTRKFSSPDATELKAKPQDKREGEIKEMVSKVSVSLKSVRRRRNIAEAFIVD